MVSKEMGSSSSLKQGPVPMDNVHITPEATYEAVVADPKLFMGSLERIHSQLGTKFMVPIIGGKDLDLHKLFIEVTSRGGIIKIIHERRWKEVTSKFAFPATATNASYVMRKYYFSLLKNYEQIYFFTSNSHIPPDSLRNQSTVMGLGTIRPPQELQAPQPRIDFGGHLTGPNVIGVIDGKFEDGYLVTVTMGTKQLRGVLYELLPQQSHCSFPNTNANPQVVTTKRRRRRKKSEIKRRDPAHPKPNRSGYNFFFSDQHARLKPLNPGKDREISRMIGELWNKLNEQERLVYQGKAMEDKERYLIEMEEYREKLRTGQLMISNAVPLQQMLPPEVNLDMAAEADLVIEEDEEGDSSDCSGESEPRDDDRELEEPALNRLGLNLNSNRTAIVVGDVVMETCPSKKPEEPECGGGCC
ncbi:hypothetical protein IGI04_032747 [Brassica rapa subsp. trilocularis]|nr:high mobility group B protein 15-like isoform X2 [Brassica rapa]XP_022546539.2 high mobility group B protein 15-like [Brassica napus]KAG5391206.1 hypothetical protein IGI04_032747 [Brassica rapa subsp. trilocularis]